ncbi:hydroxymethylpyrimidine/phosphomethylpyrimidine kinase [Acidobacteriota bacterium]
MNSLRLPAKSGVESVLVIAGFDPSGCAGVLADLRHLAALKVHGEAVISAVTFQSSQEFVGYRPLPVEWLDGQLTPILAGSRPRITKAGMLGNAATVKWLAEKADKSLGRLVLDPVLRATRGGDLIDQEGIHALRRHLLPLTFAVTPNLGEAEALSGMERIENLEGMKAAARKISTLGARHIIITGGHFKGDCPDLWHHGSEFMLFRSPRVETDKVRGIGTLFSAALAGYLARGKAFSDALLAAKRHVVEALLERERDDTGPLVLPANRHEVEIEVREI